VADLAGGTLLAVRLHRALPAGGERLVRPLLRTLAAATLMAVPALLLAQRLPAVLPGRWAAQLAMLAAAVVGIGCYLLLQRWWRAPELALLRALRPGRVGGTGDAR
jgi:putative peptidoglycan lipid II flippase